MSRGINKEMIESTLTRINKKLQHLGSKIRITVGGRYGYKAIDYDDDPKYYDKEGYVSGSSTFKTGISKSQAYDLLDAIEFGIDAVPETKESKKEDTKEEKGYQGWRNHATWAVALHISNDQGLYDMVQEEAKRIYGEAEADKYNTKSETAIYELSNWLKDTFSPESELWGRIYDDLMKRAPLLVDMLNGYFDDVDWREVSESIYQGMYPGEFTKRKKNL